MEYTDYILCKEVYHCTPSELDEQDWSRVRAHITCMNVESKVKKHRIKQSQKGKGN